MKGIILGFSGHELNAIHTVDTWDHAIQDALNAGLLFDQALILDLEHSCPIEIFAQARECTDTGGPDGEPFPINVTVVTNLDEANAKLPARHVPKLQSPT